MRGETLDRLLTPGRNYPPSIDFPSPAFIFFFSLFFFFFFFFSKKFNFRKWNIKLFFKGWPFVFFFFFLYAKKIHCRTCNIKVIVTGEPLAFYMKACKGQPRLCFHFAHTIIQLGRLCIFVRTKKAHTVPFCVIHTYSVTNNVVGVTQDWKKKRKLNRWFTKTYNELNDWIATCL